MGTNLFTLRGVRGTRPAIGPAFRRYGSSTTSFSLQTEAGFLVVDSGTGILSLSDVCLAAGPDLPIAIFYTHFHFDHTLGLRTFEPLYREGFTIRLYGVSPSPRHPWPDLLTTLFDEPYWPAPIRHLPARVSYGDLDNLQQPMPVCGADISWCELTHTQRCLGYRITCGDHNLVILTDHEPQLAPDNRVEAFCQGADVLIMDAQYRPDEYAAHRGWGHGTWEDATAMARNAGVGRLILCHHAPDRTDDDLDEIQRLAQAVFPNTQLAHEQLTLRM